MTWDGKERRRRNGSDPVTLDDLDEALEIHAAKEREHTEQLIKSVLKAFPNEDVQGHHDYHNAKIMAAKAEQEFWQAAKAEATKRGVGAVFVVLKWLAILAVLGLAYKWGFGPVVAKFLGVAVT